MNDRIRKKKAFSKMKIKKLQITNDDIIIAQVPFTTSRSDMYNMFDRLKSALCKSGNEIIIISSDIEIDLCNRKNAIERLQKIIDRIKSSEVVDYE
jgi:hypothetical protein